MICLNCGVCCFYLVVVVKPEVVDKIKSLDDVKHDDLIALDGSTKCPHFEYNNGKSFCKIHDYPWFKDTPCGKYAQIGDDNAFCRTGEYLKNNLDLHKKVMKYNLKDN